MSIRSSPRLRLTRSFVVALLVAAACTRTGAPPRAGVSPDAWIASAPSEVGLVRAPLDQLASEIRAGQFGNVHAVLVARQGRLAFESYFSGEDRIGGRGSIGHITFGPETLHDLRSVTKSIVSTIVGIAIDEGHLPSVDAPVHTLLPQFADLVTGAKQSITLRHLLTMTAGLEWDETSFAEEQNDEIRMNRSGDALRYVLSKPLVVEPGTVFNYSGGATQLLAAIVETGVGRTIEDYAREVLFGPLGITEIEWPPDLQGIPRAASGLRLNGRDVMKLGLMFAAGGRWEGRQIVPEAWLEEAMRPSQDLPVLPEDRSRIVRAGYGHQWRFEEYVTPRGPMPTTYANGNGGQRIYIVPDHDLVVVTLAGFYNEPTWAPEDILLRVVGAIQ